MAIDESLDRKVYDNISSLEKELTVAIDDNPKELKRFLGRLSDAQKTAKRAIAENLLSKKTISLIRSVALTGSAIAKFALSAEKYAMRLEKKRQAQLEEAMAKLSLEDRPEKSAELFASANTSTPTPSTHESTDTPHHISLSLKWLLDNIHEPFLTYEARSRIAKQSGVSEKTLSDWFVNARRKIGWTSIQKKFFNKSRAFTIDCARSVFLGEPSKGEIRSEVADAFRQMKKTAEALFKEKCEPSINSKELEELVAEKEREQESGIADNLISGSLERRDTAPKTRKKRQREEESSESKHEVSQTRQSKRLRYVPPII